MKKLQNNKFWTTIQRLSCCIIVCIFFLTSKLVIVIGVVPLQWGNKVCIFGNQEQKEKHSFDVAFATFGNAHLCFITASVLVSLNLIIFVFGKKSCSKKEIKFSRQFEAKSSQAFHLTVIRIEKLNWTLTDFQPSRIFEIVILNNNKNNREIRSTVLSEIKAPSYSLIRNPEQF